MNEIRTCYIPYFENDVSFSYFTEIECYSWYNVFTPLGESESSEWDGLAFMNHRSEPAPSR
jgi:hypothetical protein